MRARNLAGLPYVATFTIAVGAGDGSISIPRQKPRGLFFRDIERSDHGGCGGLTVVAPPVEALISEAVLYRLDTPELADALADRAAADATLAALNTALAEDQEQLRELSVAYGDKQITMRWWRVAREEIPAEREERIDWLFHWWERIDDWIEDNRLEPL